MATQLPFEIVDLDGETNKQVADNFSDIQQFVKVGKEGFLLEEAYRHEAVRLYNFKVRPDDIWITGCPRSGTTMLEEMALLIVNGVDFEKTKALGLSNRVMFFEAGVLGRNFSNVDSEKRARKFFLDHAKRIHESSENNDGCASFTSKRRVIKTHLPFFALPTELLTSGCKVIYTARNPKDVLVSFYHLRKESRLRHFTGTFETFFKLFINDLLFYNPYWSHLEQAWNKRHSPNFKFIFYEDTTTNLERSIEEIVEFLGEELTSRQIDSLKTVMKFDQFKKYRASLEDSRQYGVIDPTKNFVRHGKIGGWKDYLTPEMEEAADKWIRENSERIGIVLPTPSFKK